MFRLGPFAILTETEARRIERGLLAAEREFDQHIEKAESLAKTARRQQAVIEEQSRQLRALAHDRDRAMTNAGLANARALEYQGLFTEQQAEIESLRRQVTISRHPSSMPPPEAES